MKNRFILSYFIKLRTIIVLILLYSVTSISFAQINHTNYYQKFKKSPLSYIDWLRISDAVPIIIDELKNYGCHRAFIRIGAIVEPDDETKFITHVSYQHKDTTIAFIYLQGHSIQISKKHRERMLNQTELKNTLSVYNLSVSENYQKSENVPIIKTWPKNIIVLDENCYFFEEDGYDKKIKYPLSKEVITDILRHDIRHFLKELKFDKQLEINN